MYREVLAAQYSDSPQAKKAKEQSSTSTIDPFQMLVHTVGPSAVSTLENMTCIFDVPEKIEYKLKKLEKTGDYAKS